MEKINGMLTKKLNLLRQQKQSQAQFKRRTLYVPNLMPIWVDPNDNNSTVNSGVELTQSDSIHFHDVQWSTMLITEMNSVIYALVSAHEISKFEV